MSHLSILMLLGEISVPDKLAPLAPARSRRTLMRSSRISSLMRFDTPAGVLRVIRSEAGEERLAFFDSGAQAMPLYYRYREQT